MILYLHKATQKPYWGSLDETDSAMTTTELTEINQTAQSLSHIRCRFDLHSYEGRAAFKACRLSFFILTTGGMRLM